MRGSVDKYAVSGGVRWRIRWDLPPDPDTGERRQGSRGGFATLREADAALRAVLGQVEQGVYVPPARATLAAYLRGWLAGLTVRPTTFDNYWRSAERKVIPRIGGVALRELQPEHLDALYRELERRGKVAGPCRVAGVTCGAHGCAPDRHGGLAPKSVRHVHTMLHKALQDAAERGHVPRNVAALANPPRKRATRSKRARDECWTAGQLRTFLAHVADERLCALWQLFATTGLRRAEALGLRWSDLDLDGAQLRVGRQTVTAVAGRAVWSDDGKSPSAERTIALDPATLDALRAHRRRQAAERLAAGPVWSEDGHDGDLIFTRADGRALHPKRVSQMFTCRAVAAGLPTIGVHGLRHTYATAALRAGVPVEVLSRRLGHADVATTLRIYAHVLEGDDARAARTAAAAILKGGR